MSTFETLGVAPLLFIGLSTCATTSENVNPFFFFFSFDLQKAATVALPSALTGDAPSTSGANEVSSSESSAEVANEEKDHRRLDTDGDLLEEFLENEGKILRLPTGSDLDVDIDELTKVNL